MRDRQLVYRGLAVRVDGVDDDLAWLHEFLAPAFVARDGGDADWHVQLVSDATALARLQAHTAGARGLVSWLVLDRGPVRLPAWSDGAGGLLVRDDGAGAAYRIDAEQQRLDIVCAPHERTRRTALMKAVRELAMSSAWTPDSLVLHAAACADARGALLIAGPKRAGKSSLLLHLLRAPGMRLLSNDRVVVDCGTAPFAAHGMPTIVSLRHGTVEQLCATAADASAPFRYGYTRTLAEAEASPPPTDSSPRPINVSPAQLSRLLGVDMIGSAVPLALLLPRVDPQAAGIGLRRLDAETAAAHLADVSFGAALPPHISDVLRSSTASVPDAVAVRRVWRRLVERLRVFECRLGPDAYRTDPARAVVEPVLRG
jgi:hypothetical protein